MVSRVEMIRTQLEAAFAPSILNIEDQSAQHRHHTGHGGGGHFRVHITSKAFDNQPMLKRHQMVYEALASMMNKEIHALSIHALDSNEQ